MRQLTDNRRHADRQAETVGDRQNYETRTSREVRHRQTDRDVRQRQTSRYVCQTVTKRPAGTDVRRRQILKVSQNVDRFRVELATKVLQAYKSPTALFGMI